jgi:hypothetical protein
MVKNKFLNFLFWMLFYIKGFEYNVLGIAKKIITELADISNLTYFHH